MQGAGGGRIQRVFDGTCQLIQGGFVAFDGFGGGRLLRGQVSGGKIGAVDQIAGGAHELGGRGGTQLERRDVFVEHRLGLFVADPLAGGHARTTAHAGLGFKQGHRPTFVLQLIGRREPRQAATDDDGRRLLVLRQRRNAEEPYHHQRTRAQPTSRHSANSGIKQEKFQVSSQPAQRTAKNTSAIKTPPATSIASLKVAGTTQWVVRRAVIA
ncbi:hypothetical protein ALO79_200244 [Pseudomonas syringae pv. castaneae]|uniref:Uncharacterized protein n=1 Tax=Pseudomonas syringae pv. castaneae TaxID=264450 RepID=A0A0P9NQD6_PSESX|nr:hypothetical protein ALO79_200244 [Pseudomonas syringae pv. castaneae]